MKSRRYLSIATLALTLVAVDCWTEGAIIPSHFVISEAQARVGRPATPRSVAGVARRTTRRVVRRSAIYVSTLPRGCSAVVINGVSIWQCGGAYYQSYGGRYVVVYVD
ncbi:hypothetical protein NBH19_00015 [Rhizobium sp. S95]|uniref:Uncharacterized protein n=1 Tax=Ciceribacter sichuanensis TaxID=2949647 RepID=A0AAJ1F6D8_9HYPH|nr:MULTISPECIES: hypothetical protein [unclassified Ciceribacter]MCM2394457.1 hypothetical protein [Ciceribacter sp. S95]MCO5958835.1 hypothetical protein [Ciceribacter sp. S101]